MWDNRLRSYVARTVYEVWKNQGEPQTLDARDVLAYYMQSTGDITAKTLSEVLAVMEDDPGLMPFFRVQLKNKGGEMAGLGLADINPERLLVLASETSS